MPQSDGAAAQAQDKAQEVAGQAKEKAQQAAGQAKDQLRTQVDQRSTQAGEQVSQQAGDIRTVAEQLREQGKDGPAKVAEQAADRIEQVGSYLSESDADRILSDVEDFARQRPLAVIAGGIALGLRGLALPEGERAASATSRAAPCRAATGSADGHADRATAGATRRPTRRPGAERTAPTRADGRRAQTPDDRRRRHGGI